MGRRSLVSVVLVLSALSLLSKLLGFVREQVIAGSFGVSAVTDALYAAQTLPTVLQAVVAVAAATALVPLFAAAHRRGKEQVQRFAATALLGLAGLFTLESLLLWTAAGPLTKLLTPGLEPGALVQAVALTRIYALTVPFMGLSAVLTGLANANQQYLLPALAAMASNLAVIAAAVLLRDALTVEKLTWAILIGYGCHALLLGPVIRRGGLPLVTTRPDWPGLTQIARLSLPLLLSNGVAQLTPVFDKYFASRLAPGSIAALNYGSKLAQLPAGVVAMGLSAVLLTRFSNLAAEGRLGDLAEAVGRAVRWLIFGMAPASLLVVVMPAPLVALAFQHGTFGAQAVAMTTPVLAWYGLGLLPMAGLAVLSGALSALKEMGTQFRAALAATVAYLLLAAWLSSIMAQGGLALALSASQLVAASLMLLALWRRLGRRVAGVTLPLLATTFAGLLVGGVALHWAEGLPLAPLARLLAGGLSSALLYLGVQLVGRNEEALQLAGALRRIARKEWGLLAGLKRSLDLCGALAGLVLLSPLMALVAIGVWLDLGTPVLFRQQRTGLHGRPFTLFKFRSMRNIAGLDGKPLPTAARLTPLGRVLRATSMDELPQLFNVLRGDMSLVGPRPLLPRYLPFYTERERQRFVMRPGLTGWAQIHGRNRTPWNQRLELDVWYVEHWSFWLDLRILIATASRALRPGSVAVDPGTAGPSLDQERRPLRAPGPQ